MKIAVPLMAALLLATAQAGAEVVVKNAWVRAAPPGVKMMAGYLEIDNRSGKAARLRGVSSDDFNGIMLHATVVEDGVARMTHLDGIEVPAGEVARLAPGGMHLMLMGPQRDLQPGDSVVFRFDFDGLEVCSVRAEVSRHDPHAEPDIAQ